MDHIHTAEHAIGLVSIGKAGYTAEALDAMLSQIKQLTRDVTFLMDAYIATQSPCENCGSDIDVTYGPNPFAEEIHDDHTPVWLCQRCRQELADDI